MTTKIEKILNNKTGKSVLTSDNLFFEVLKSIDICIQFTFLSVDISKRSCAFNLLFLCPMILLQMYQTLWNTEENPCTLNKTQLYAPNLRGKLMI